MTDRELLELIAAQVGALTKDVSELKEGQNILTKDVSELKEGQNILTKDVSELKEGQNILTKDVSELKEGQNTLTKDVSELKESQEKVEGQVRKISITIENDIRPKVTSLFDGHTQVNNQLDRIEKEVSRHEEVIIRKIK